MGYRRAKFEQRVFEQSDYQRYFHKNQAEYIRTRLRCVQLYHQGKDFDEIAITLSIHHQSVRKYVNIYIVGGFAELCIGVVRPQSCQLTGEQMISFKEILLSQSPNKVGLEGNIWTGNLMCEYLKKTYNITYKSGIYDLLDKLNLSHQKAHADYANAKPSEQIAFINDLKNTILSADEKTTIVKFDEFSVCEKPTAYYGWAEKNTRPKFTTDEKKENGLTVF